MHKVTISATRSTQLCPPAAFRLVPAPFPGMDKSMVFAIPSRERLLGARGSWAGGSTEGAAADVPPAMREEARLRGRAGGQA